MSSCSETILTLTSLRFKNVSLVLLCGLFTYLFRLRDNYSFHLSWEIPIDVSLYPNGKFFEVTQDLPRPIVTDLNGDGINDLVMIGNDYRLKVFENHDGEVTKMKKNEGKGDKSEVNKETSCDDKLRGLDLKSEILLPQNYDETGSRSRPVALATGYVSRYQSIIQVRHQVIVVAFDTWHVACFAADLKLMWLVQLLAVPHSVSQDYFVNAMTILVTSGRHKDEDGLVVIGGSFEHLAHHHKKKELEHHREGKGSHGHEHGTREEEDLTHFTTFALNARDGSVRWHHLPGDFEEHTKEQFDLFAHPVHWKLALNRNKMHKKQVPWQTLQSSFLLQLPHSWMSRADTRSSIAKVKKLIKSAKDVKAETNAGKLITLNVQRHLPRFLENGFGPHSSEDHVTDANSVVIQSQGGIEMLDLKTGEPIAILPLISTSHRVTWADVDDDHVIDEIFIEFEKSGKNTLGSETGSGTDCYLRAKKAFSQTDIFNLLLLLLLLWMSPPPPLVIPSFAHRSGLWHHITGYSLHRGQHGKDVIALLADGRVTSIGSRGEMHWQSATASSWDHLVQDASFFKSKPSEGAFDFVHDVFRPHLVPMTRQSLGKTDSVLVAGSHFLSLVNLKDGDVLADVGLPCPPQSSSVTPVDFSGDGLTDVVVTCPSGVTGIELRVIPAKGMTALIGVTVAGVAWILTWLANTKKKSRESPGVEMREKKEMSAQQYLEQFED